MNDLFTARAQRNITYAWMLGFFGLLLGEGLGYVKDVPHESLFAMTGVVLYFWFNRTRTQETPEPNTRVTTSVSATSIPPAEKGES